jgi:hypothetical protein
LAKPNYSFQKRQREIAKKQKKEEKRQRKGGPEDAVPGEAPLDDAAPPAAPAEIKPVE